jgi:hypothetical protein
MDMPDRTLVLVMTQGIGANLTNDEKRAHLIDLKREYLIDQVCVPGGTPATPEPVMTERVPHFRLSRPRCAA